MPRLRKPKKPLGFWETQDKVIGLNNIYRTELFGADRRKLAQGMHGEVDSTATPEPGEDLEDGELTENEQRSAIQRERMRRDGLD